MDRRLLELDGLRAIAVIMVIWFHFFQRFPSHYPYGSEIMPSAIYGDMGVELFFMVSGFVIAMTLHASESIFAFAVRRATRLWPPMVICSLATFAVLHVVDTAYALEKRPYWTAFLPSWTFTDPKLWRWIFPDITYIDGVYWTLFVEVRFYFWVSLFFFLVGAKRFVKIFCSVFLALAVVRAGADQAGAAGIAFVLDGLFVAEYMHLFCAGILFHELFSARGAAWKTALIGLCMALVTVKEVDPVRTAVTWAFFAVFFALVWNRKLLRPLRVAPLVWIGWCSYSLYLLHHHIGVAAITLLPQGRSDTFYLSVVVGIGAILFGASFVVYITVERRSGRWAQLFLPRRPPVPNNCSE